MNDKDHIVYLKILKSMTPEQRLLKAFELSEMTKQLFLQGLKKRYPDLSEKEFHKLYLERLKKCHNSNY